MIVKFLGFIDICAVAVLLFSPILPRRLVMIFALLLVAKGLFFALTGNLVSWLDFLSGVYFAVVAFGHPVKSITIIVLIFLAQKAFLSFI
jgi:hypothetical protein